MKVSDIEVTAIHPERWGDDLDVVNAARVSFNKESEWEFKNTLDYEEFYKWTTKEGWTDTTEYESGFYSVIRLSDKDSKLIQYLAKHKHFSPFNHSFIKVRVKAPIFVARQLVKHEYMPWNEVSRRYVIGDCEFWFPEGLRKRAESLKQGSERCYVENSAALLADIKNQAEKDLALYNRLIDNDVAPEVARQVLPPNLMTEWMWSGTLKAFAKMLSLRLDPHAQEDTRVVAQKIRELVEPVFPVSIPALLSASL